MPYELPDQIPAHLLEFQVDDLESLGSIMADNAEQERSILWDRAWYCAAARYRWPLYDQHGKKTDEGAALVGYLAHIFGRSGQRIRDWIAVGCCFQPDQVETMKQSFSVFEACLAADDPLSMARLAHDEHLTARQVREWLAEAKTTERITVIQTSFPHLSQNFDLVIGQTARDAVARTIPDIIKRPGRLVEVKMSIVAVYELSEKERITNNGTAETNDQSGSGTARIDRRVDRLKNPSPGSDDPTRQGVETKPV